MVRRQSWIEDREKDVGKKDGDGCPEKETNAA